MPVCEYQLDAGPINHLGVDRDHNVIRGIVAAEVGTFKTRRGKFRDQDLDQIAKLINSNDRGFISYLGHPSSGNDVDRPYLGVFKNARRDGGKTRVDLHLSKTAMKPQPNTKTDRSWGEYVMDLAEEDPRALGFSLRPGEIDRQSDGGTVSAWHIKTLRGGDIVLEGDATNSFLSSDDPDGTDTSEDLNSPEMEGSQVPLDNETKSFIQDTISNSVTAAIESALSAREAREQELANASEIENREQEADAKLAKADLALAAVDFAERALGKMPKEDVTSLSSQIREGKLTSEAAMIKFNDHLLSSGASSMDDGAGETTAPASKEDAKLKEEYDLAVSMGLEVGDFETYKDSLSAGYADFLE